MHSPLRTAVILFLFSVTSIFGADTTGLGNSWTKATSGYWEEPYWSLGELPSIRHGETTFGNAGWKALAIGAQTTANYPDSLSISNLYVDAPPDSSNLLLLNWAGLAVPLSIVNDFRIQPRCALLSFASALRAKTFYCNGQAMFDVESSAQFEGIEIGRYITLAEGPALLTISNATLSVSNLWVPGNGYAQVNQYGGANYVGGMQLNGTNAYNLRGGVLVVSNLAALIATGSDPQLKIGGGTAKMLGTINLGRSPEYGAGGGAVELASGNFEIQTLNVKQGSFNQTGGSSAIANMILPEAGYGGEATLSGGTMRSDYISLGRVYSPSYPTDGQFTQSGGVHINTNQIEMLGEIRHYTAHVHGTYTLNGGRLEAAALHSSGGMFEQFGGTNIVTLFSLDSVGGALLGGGVSQIGNVDIGAGYTATLPYSSGISVTGGVHVVKEIRAGDLGGFGFWGGSLTVSNIFLSGSGRFSFGDVNFTHTGTLDLGGALYAGTGNQPLGFLQVSGGTINFGNHGSTVLRFRDSRNVPWSGQLLILNWNGSYSGDGADRLYVGNSGQGLTPSQVSQIFFGYASNGPTNHYPARILSTGEIVPATGPTVTYTRTPNGLVINWPPGHYLVTSTNVTGPYVPLPDWASYYPPFTNTFTDPQRFFQISNPPPVTVY